MDIEIHVPTPDSSTVRAWLFNQFANVHLVDDRFGEIFHGQAGATEVSIMITPKGDAGDWTAFSIGAQGDLPWHSDREMGRAAFAATAVGIRCCVPGDRNPFHWLAIDAQGERLVSWTIDET